MHISELYKPPTKSSAFQSDKLILFSALKLFKISLQRITVDCLNKLFRPVYHVLYLCYWKQCDSSLSTANKEYCKKKKKENFKNTSYILLEKEPLSEDII